jgi:hypothetical protein
MPRTTGAGVPEGGVANAAGVGIGLSVTSRAILSSTASARGSRTSRLISRPLRASSTMPELNSTMQMAIQLRVASRLASQLKT